VQFYQLHKPAITIVVSHPPSNKKVLIEALNTIAKNKVRIIGKQFSNHIADLIELTVNNAQQSLSHSQKQSQKQLHSLQLLKDCFALRNLPNVIEIYDNSHLQGSHAFGCYVAAENGALNKKLYRTFKIKSIQGAVGDDYAMLAETITRRAKKLTDGNRPNLLIIDGGKGQLSCVMQTLKNLNWHDVEVVCMSKGPERNSGREFFHQPNKLAFQLPIGDPALSYLHMLRNEAHRFAITTHRRSILKTVKKSGIDSIPQIGPARKTALLSYFGSFELLKNASMIDIARVPGISKKIAKMIINYLHNHTND
jgi:excinuclease ABC subunit C